MHDSKSTTQRTASKLFVVIWDTNMKQDNQVARDLPGEEHLHREWQAAGKLGRTMSAPAPGGQKERTGEGCEPCTLPSTAASPEQSALCSHQWGRAPSAMQKRGSRSPCQLRSTQADSQYLHPLTQGSQQPIVPQGPPAEELLPITWRWGQWLGEADACAQHNGSARQHQNQHKI